MVYDVNITGDRQIQIASESTTSQLPKTDTEQRINETAIDKSAVEEVIDKTNVEIQKSDIIHEVVAQPIIEVKRSEEQHYVPVPQIAELYQQPIDLGNSIEQGNNVSNISQPIAAEVVADLLCVGKNELWGLSNQGRIFRLLPKFQGVLQWELFPTGNLLFRAISGTKRSLIGIGLYDGVLYSLCNSTKRFEHVFTGGPVLKSVSAMSKRNVYVVSEDGSVLSLVIRRRKKIPAWNMGGSMKKISVGARHLMHHKEIWAIGVDDYAYRWNRPKGWQQIPTQVLDISVGTDNSVFAVGMDGKLMKWDKKTFHTPLSSYRGIPENVFITNVAAYKRKKYMYCIERGTNNILKAQF